MEIDADSLKSPMSNYFEQLNRALEQNADDADELQRIYARVVSDRSNLSTLETRIQEQINYLRNFVIKKGEIADILGRAIRERKDA